MKKEKDKWEEFKELPEAYETNDDLVPKVKYEIFREKHAKRRIHWQAIVASITIGAIGVGVFVPVYLSNHTKEESDEGKYYSENKLIKHPIENIEEYLTENDLDVLYYTEETVKSISMSIQDSNELALISQEMDVIEGNFIDKVQLNIQLMSDAKFSMFNEFEELAESCVISDISIEYSVRQISRKEQILAKFTYESIPYYLEIQTDDATGKLEKYINMLFEEQEETYLDDGVIVNSVVEDPRRINNVFACRADNVLPLYDKIINLKEAERLKKFSEENDAKESIEEHYTL